MYRFEGTGFSNIPQLIEHHYTTKQVITKKSGVVLLNPIPKVGIYIYTSIYFFYFYFFKNASSVNISHGTESSKFFFIKVWKQKGFVTTSSIKV